MENSSWRSKTWYQKLYHNISSQTFWGWKYYGKKLSLTNKIKCYIDINCEAWMDYILVELYHRYLQWCKVQLISLRKCTEYSQVTFWRSFRLFKEQFAFSTGSHFEVNYDNRFSSHFLPMLLGIGTSCCKSARSKRVTCPIVFENILNFFDLDSICIYFWHRAHSIDSKSFCSP